MSERNQSRLLTVGEVAKRSGVAVSTLHFYESKGLIKSIRTNGNQRRFTLVVLRYIAIIKIAQKVGIPLDEIKQALSKYPMGSKLTAQQWKELSLDWRKNLDERIQKLTRLRDCKILDKTTTHSCSYHTSHSCSCYTTIIKIKGRML